MIAKLLVAMCILASVAVANDVPEADKKWGGAVEKMIAEGATTVSTPIEGRAKLAKQLAAKQGREATIEKTDKGFKVTFQGKKLAKN